MGYNMKMGNRNTVQSEITWVPLNALKYLKDDLTLH